MMNATLLTKAMALLVSIMMLIPMASASGAAEASYAELEISDVKVNYMGTELDFSGLDITLLGGMDAQNKNLISGLTASLPGNTNASFAVELGKDEMAILMFDQIVKIPYDRVGEAMAKMNPQLEIENDITEQMNMFWTFLANASDFGELFLEQMLDASQEKINSMTVETFVIKLAAARPESASFEYDGVTYNGNKFVVSLTPEETKELVMAALELDKFDEYKSMLAPIFEGMEGGEEVMAMLEGIVTAFSSISFPNGMTMTIYDAGLNDGSKLEYITIDRFTYDMSEYVKSVMSMAGATDEISAEEIEKAKVDMDVTASVITKGEEVQHLDERMNLYMSGSDTSFMEVYVDANGNDSMNASVIIDPAGLGEEGEIYSVVLNSSNAASKANISLTIYAGETDVFTFTSDTASEALEDGEQVTNHIVLLMNAVEDLGTQEAAVYIDTVYTDNAATNSLSINATAFQEDTQLGDFTFDAAHLKADNSGYIAINSNDPELGAVGIFELEYAKQENADNTETAFDMNVMGMIGVSGKLSYQQSAMDESKLMTTDAQDVILNMADATEEDIEALMMGVQVGMTNALNAVTKVPAIAALISSFETESEVLAG